MLWKILYRSSLSEIHSSGKKLLEYFKLFLILFQSKCYQVKMDKKYKFDWLINWTQKGHLKLQKTEKYLKITTFSPKFEKFEGVSEIMKVLVSTILITTSVGTLNYWLFMKCLLFGGHYFYKKYLISSLIDFLTKWSEGWLKLKRCLVEIRIICFVFHKSQETKKIHSFKDHP